MPLQHLDPGQIPEAEHFPWQPRELVAVLGSHRGRHWGPISALAFLGRADALVASAGPDGVRVWSARTLRERGCYPCAGRHVAFSAHTSEAFSLGLPDEEEPRLCATNLVNGATRRWPLPAQVNPSLVTALAVSHDGKLAAIGDEAGSVYYARLEAAGLPNWVALPAHHDEIHCLAFSSDRARPAFLACGSNDASISLWELGGPLARLRTRLRGHESAVTALAFAEGRRVLASGDYFGEVRLWGLDRARIVSTSPLHRGPDESVTAVAFSPSGRVLAAAGPNGDVALWDLSWGTAVALARLPATGQEGFLEGCETCVAFSAQGRHLVSGSDDGSLRLAQLRGGRLAEQSRLHGPGHRSAVTEVVVSPDGRRILSCAAEPGRHLLLWELGEEGPRLVGGVAGSSPCCFSADGGTLLTSNEASGWNFSGLHVWDLAGAHPHCLRTLRNPEPAEEQPDLPDYLVELEDEEEGEDPEEGDPQPCDAPAQAIEGLQGAFRFWLLASFNGEPNKVLACAADTAWVLTLNGEGATAEQVRAPEGIVAVSSTGRFLVTAPEPSDPEIETRTAAIWELTGSEPRKLAEFAVSGGTLAISADGELLAVANHDGRVALLGARSGQELRSWQLPGEVSSLALGRDGDGHYLVSGNSNGTVYVLRLGVGVAAGAGALATPGSQGTE